DSEFLALANNINDRSAVHVTDWKLDADQVSALKVLVTNANAAYAANNEIATRNLTTSVAKKYAFSELKNFLSVYINALEGNLHVPDEALGVMGLRPRHRRARKPLDIPKVAPVMSVTRQHDELTVYVSQPEYNHPAASVASEKYGGFALRWRFEDETEYRTVNSTRLHLTLLFEGKDETRRVVLSAAFVNPRLQTGPWSDDITEVIG
ncbi:MAG: hypothetical protein LBJ47_09320, partial [Tannerella sp.]|nr:hypothetical protein [Tannerella sp.]